MSSFPDKISLSDLVNFNRQSNFRKDALEAVKYQPEETTNYLVNQIISLQEMFKQQLLPKIKDPPVFKVEYPTHPMDTFNETLLQYFKNLPEQEQVVWQGLTAADLAGELANKSELAGRFVAELLDSILSTPDFFARKAESWDAEKHGKLTQLAVDSKSPYLLIKTLKVQLDRVAMKGHIENGNVNTYLYTVEDLKILANALAQCL